MTSIKEEKPVEEKKPLFKKEDESSDEDSTNSQSGEWWEQENIAFPKKGEQRWRTLSHNGVMFPPEYVPHNIPILYDGTPFYMTPEEEEVATMFAVMREFDYYRSPIFRSNFFRSWRNILEKRKEPHPIKRLDLCNFDAIYHWHKIEREKRLNRTKEEKKAIKLEQEKLAEPYKWCVWDGKREQVANFRVEPPGLFRGRGQHPLQGTLKVRVQPEDITINIDDQSPIPTPPEGHRWNEIIHDNTVTWLAMWRDSVGENFKYVMLAPTSAVKGQSDLQKYEKARTLKHCIARIRESYTKDFQSSDVAARQRAVAIYFIDKLALRVGNEKSSDEADTVGCCSLRVEHITLLPENIVKFDFLGKDSIRYVNEVKVLPEVYNLVKEFMRKKKPDDDLFDQVTPSHLNNHFKSYMDGLTAKVFRTYNASITMHQCFQEHPVDPKASVDAKVAYFNKVNADVAILCNHQKAVSKNFRSQVVEIEGKLTHTRIIIQLLEEAKKNIGKKGVEVAAKNFFQKVDEMQWEWLNAYGTEEERKAYAAIVENRSAPKVQATKKVSRNMKEGEEHSKVMKSKSKAQKSKKNAKKISGSSKSNVKGGKKASKTLKPTPRKKGEKKLSESSEEDVTLAEMASVAKKKKNQKVSESSKRKRPRESSSDDDVPLSSLV